MNPGMAASSHSAVAMADIMAAGPTLAAGRLPYPTGPYFPFFFLPFPWSWGTTTVVLASALLPLESVAE